MCNPNSDILKLHLVLFITATERKLGHALSPTIYSLTSSNHLSNLKSLNSVMKYQFVRSHLQYEKSCNSTYDSVNRENNTISPVRTQYFLSHSPLNDEFLGVPMPAAPFARYCQVLSCVYHVMIIITVFG